MLTWRVFAGPVTYMLNKNTLGVKKVRGQEEATVIRKTKIMQPLSELFTRKTAKKSLTL